MSRTWSVCSRRANQIASEEVMEANIQLIRIIQEMRAEINKLEKENQALRIKLTANSRKTSGSGGVSGDGKVEDGCKQSPPSLHSLISPEPTPAVQDHQGEVMIIRRYSVSSPACSFAGSDPWKTRDHLGTTSTNKRPYNGVLEAQETVKALACSSIKKQDNEQKMLATDSRSSSGPSQRASPEDDFGCRDKTKTVSFLLPMDTPSYSKNSSFLKYSPNRTTDPLSIIAE